MRPKVFSIPPGVRFLPTLAEALMSGELVPGFRFDGDPLKLADATIYVPTRRAARELRSAFVDLAGGRSAILPVIRALGEFDEDEAAFEGTGADDMTLPPPIAPIERLLLLAPLVRAWKRKLPAHVAALYAEDVIVPASSADSVWLARDLAVLMDEIETEGADWGRLGELVSGNLAGWWQVTLNFLEIVTTAWPQALAERDRSNPAAHRDAQIRAEARRLERNPPTGPVVAAGSTGSIPATAELLSVISRLPGGAVVLPGLDKRLDERSWSLLRGATPKPSVFGHPQYGLAKLADKIGVARDEVEEIGQPGSRLGLRAAILSQALRPAETTDLWAEARDALRGEEAEAALAGITLLEAANERDEAIAVAIALRLAVEQPGKTAALVTADRNLARRVSTELLRFGIRADDSGGTPLVQTAPATLAGLMLQAVFRPGDPVPVLSLLKHPLLGLGLERATVRRAAETIELVALRGGTGRPDIATLADAFRYRLGQLAGDGRKPFWYDRMSARRMAEAQELLSRLSIVLAPLVAQRGQPSATLAELLRTTIVAMEGLARSASGDVSALYAGDAGDKFAALLRSLLSADAAFELAADEWPDVMVALVAPEVVKPAAGGDGRVSIWGALEARLQAVDTLVLGGLNEGSWPRRAEADRFMSRMMKTGLTLEPPERRIGQAAHDFMMAMGTERVILTRAARAGDAPAVASRWLQRLLTYAGPELAEALRRRGQDYLSYARQIDEGPRQAYAPRPSHAPPLEARPRRFSVTEIETLRRDPYAVYARRVLDLFPVEPLVRDPGAAERGTLFHEILHRFVASGADPYAADATERLLACGRAAFSEAALPPDVEAVWWPRFLAMAGNIVAWERGRGDQTTARHSEVRAEPLVVGASGVTLSGYADRIDLLAAGFADILDYKTGMSPSRGQAHTLLAPQLALEAGLLLRGAFVSLGKRTPSRLAYVRLKPNGEVEEESILEFHKQLRTADDLANDAWQRMEKLFEYYNSPATGYLSRALPFREGETDGDYDHLARVLEWSAGGDDGSDGGEAS
ncbi:double-strand break repair protein AddB [Mesorhizobium sp. L-8-3]|uniref:double-strand break repair protein AddB n=1 Tax=Mesorhizobium sp. L-8-3 TaxID=2744522 RepID=UPI00192950F8|nr:double-strand break repair protein AddB [Mesorhizobium sp. L-8-3]BCH21362.1 double-strand break repair protein AddB [Mesorhizobium sp. L-8-3]